MSSSFAAKAQTPWRSVSAASVGSISSNSARRSGDAKAQTVESGTPESHLLHAVTLSVLEHTFGFPNATPVQAASIPLLLANKDVVAEVEFEKESIPKVAKYLPHTFSLPVCVCVCVKMRKECLSKRRKDVRECI